MCLIIRCEADKPLSKKLLQNMQKRNNDGFGFMYIQNNKLKTFKDSSSNFELLWEKYNEFKEFNPFIHLRYKTHGEIDFTNTHPYNCGHGIYLMHNGIIRVDDSEDRTKSDTWHFIDQLIKPLVDLTPNPHEMIRSKKFSKLMEMQLGTSNRMVLGDRGGFILFGKGNWHQINNEKTGVVGLLVSNTYAWDAHSFDPDPPPPKTTTTTYGTGSHFHGNPGIRRTPSYTNPQSQYYYHSSSNRLIDARIIYWQGQEYFQILGNIYEDEIGNIFMNNGMAMKRRKDLDAKYDDLSTRLAATSSVPKQASLPLVVVDGQHALLPASPLQLVTNTNDTATSDEEAEALIALSEEQQNEMLVAEWCKRKPYEINSLVYTEADDAATVLNILIADSNKANQNVSRTNVQLDQQGVQTAS